MRVCLISPPTVTEFEGTRTSQSRAVRLLAIQPPLGILSLAAVLELKGIAPQLFDLNRLFYGSVSRPGTKSTTDFFSLAASELRQVSADVFGFGTICNTYPLTVRLAQELKRARPDALIVFGGPQATAVDVETLEAFPFVDIVVRGEAEGILPELLDALGSPERLAQVAGISFRGDGRVVRTPDAPLLPDLDQLPMPAFHLWPDIQELRTVPLEIGRGCPFACTFCSTSRFFRRRFRLKAPERVIGQMISMRKAYCPEHFILIHDAFTVDRGRAAGFCQSLLDSGEQFRWTCSTRTDCVDEPLLALMEAAGCTGVFFGIETGSPSTPAGNRQGIGSRPRTETQYLRHGITI